MSNGTVKFFNESKGFGFIKEDENKIKLIAEKARHYKIISDFAKKRYQDNKDKKISCKMRCKSLETRFIAIDQFGGIFPCFLYRIYNNMDEIKNDVLIEINRQYDEFINSKIDSKKALLTLCIAYVEFANDYKNLFCSLFLSDNLKWKKIEDVFDEKWNQSTIINLVNKRI